MARRWGKRIEFSEPELKLLINLGSKELKRQLARKPDVDRNLVSLVNKTMRACAREWPARKEAT